MIPVVETRRHAPPPHVLAGVALEMNSDFGGLDGDALGLVERRYSDRGLVISRERYSSRNQDGDIVCTARDRDTAGMNSLNPLWRFAGVRPAAWLFFAFLYVPILVLVVLSFNSGQSATLWESFSFKWYAVVANDPEIVRAGQQNDGHVGTDADQLAQKIHAGAAPELIIEKRGVVGLFAHRRETFLVARRPIDLVAVDRVHAQQILHVTEIILVVFDDENAERFWTLTGSHA